MSDYEHLKDVAEELADRLTDWVDDPAYPPGPIVEALLPTVHRAIVSRVTDEVNAMGTKPLDREDCLDRAVRLVAGNERWTSGDVLDFAEYIRTGAIPDLSNFSRPST